jgi:hypothetical protein
MLTINQSVGHVPMIIVGAVRAGVCALSARAHKYWCALAALRHPGEWVKWWAIGGAMNAEVDIDSAPPPASASRRVMHSRIFFDCVPRYQNTSTAQSAAAFFKPGFCYNIILSAAFIFGFERAHAKANSRLHEERR